MNYTVISEIEGSKWKNITGEKYHFPKKYRNLLPIGQKILYHRGKANEEGNIERLSKEPHYFGIGTIGKTDVLDSNCVVEILNYIPFKKAILLKENQKYLEPLANEMRGYFRGRGVRPIDERSYNYIVSKAGLFTEQFEFETSETLGIEEGHKSYVTISVYERDPKLRRDAINIHGLTCKGCDLNFYDKYGKWGEGYIHIHHVYPLSKNEKPVLTNPDTDLLPVCANCHSMIHRKRDRMLSIEELRQIIQDNN